MRKKQKNYSLLTNATETGKALKVYPRIQWSL